MTYERLNPGEWDGVYFDESSEQYVHFEFPGDGRVIIEAENSEATVHEYDESDFLRDDCFIASSGRAAKSAGPKEDHDPKGENHPVAVMVVVAAGSFVGMGIMPNSPWISIFLVGCAALYMAIFSGIPFLLRTLSRKSPST